MLQGDLRPFQEGVSPTEGLSFKGMVSDVLPFLKKEKRFETKKTDEGEGKN